MKQLLMIRDNHSVGDFHFPEGYYMRSYQPSDGCDWCNCCIDGKLNVNEISEEVFAKIMLNDEAVDPSNIYFLISPTGETAGTITYQFTNEEDLGRIHMVGIQKNYLGKGLALPMTLYVVQKILEEGKARINLSTDDWRIPAIKTYFKAGFEPVYHDTDMEERWNKIKDEMS